MHPSACQIINIRWAPRQICRYWGRRSEAWRFLCDQGPARSICCCKRCASLSFQFATAATASHQHRAMGPRSDLLWEIQVPPVVLHGLVVLVGWRGPELCEVVPCSLQRSRWRAERPRFSIVLRWSVRTAHWRLENSFQVLVPFMHSNEPKDEGDWIQHFIWSWKV